MRKRRGVTAGKLNLILAVLFLVGMVLWLGSRNRLSEALLEAEANPCETPLQLTKLFGSWYLTCEGCDAIPVTPGRELPEIVFDTAEKWITNHRVSVSFVLRKMGDCD